MSPRELLQQLLERRDLSQAQAEGLLVHLTDPQLPPAMAGALLAALSGKGLAAQEVTGLAQAMRRLARRPQLPPDLRSIDVVGTGGDASGSFNISTGTALLTAACGVPVVKHGNRSVSSRCGSADVLEALGLTVPVEMLKLPEASPPVPTTSIERRSDGSCGRRAGGHGARAGDASPRAAT